MQYISEENWALIRYITGYVTKGDKGFEKDVWLGIQDVLNSSNFRSLLYKQVAQRLKKREIGAYEAAANLLGYPYSQFSIGDNAVFVNTLPEDQCQRQLKKFKEIEKMNPEETDIFCKNFVLDHYPNRPDAWQDKSLYDVVRWYRHDYKVPKKGRNELDAAFMQESALNEENAPEGNPLNEIHRELDLDGDRDPNDEENLLDCEQVNENRPSKLTGIIC